MIKNTAHSVMTLIYNNVKSMNTDIFTLLSFSL